MVVIRRDPERLEKLRLAVRYLLDGAGPFVVDPPITVTVETPVVVREAQAVVHR